jgi:hypothetical protein
MELSQGHMVEIARVPDTNDPIWAQQLRAELCIREIK